MIKITNVQISAFLSPVISELFNDKTRRFPIDDAFRFADLLDQIQKKAVIYQKQARKLIEDRGGEIDLDGVVSYPKDVKVMEVQNELNELNACTVEFTGEKLKIKDTWPELSIQEAIILRPITENGNAEKT